ncbi:MAG: hypothetical protein WBV39_00505 [Rudaea sp.]
MNEPLRQTVAESTDTLPRHTTPTWEVELLISGVAVFAMLQLPGWLNDRLQFLVPRFDAGWSQPLKIVSIYFVGAAVILAATFALHLLLRAYWIALVGIHSVYPGGIRWDRLRMGPIEREVMQRRDGDFETMIERADNRASIVFAVGVTLAVSMLVIAVLVMGLLVAGTAITSLLGWHVPPENILFVSMAVIVGPKILLNMLDRRPIDRLREHGRLRSAIAGGFGFYAKLGFANRGGVLGVLSSHHGRWRVQLIAMAAISFCMFGAIFSQMAMRNPERLGTYASFPHFDKSAAHVVDAAYYDDQRDPLNDVVVPFVQSAVIDGNFVKLVIPYQPDSDADAMQRTCPAGRKIADAQARADAMLRCLAAVHAVTLDGNPLGDQRYDAGSDTRNQRPALVAMIDVRALAPGRHEIAVARAPVPDGDGKPVSVKPWIIPFWR